MSRVTVIPTYQGHYVPPRPHAPRGPFPPDLFVKPGVETDYVPQSDSGEADLPPGATAQNGFREVKYYRCRMCESVVRDVDLDDHVCPEGTEWPEE